MAVVTPKQPPAGWVTSRETAQLLGVTYGSFSLAWRFFDGFPPVLKLSNINYFDASAVQAWARQHDVKDQVRQGFKRRFKKHYNDQGGPIPSFSNALAVEFLKALPVGQARPAASNQQPYRKTVHIQ